MINESILRLQNWHEIPAHLRFNRYVHTYYRPQSDWKGCLYSLFYIHNETVNIITHGIPIIAILLSMPTILPWTELSVPYLPWIHFVALISPWVGSTIYHLFMNHNKGYHVYKMLLLTDMIGIWIAQNFGSLTAVCSTIYCFDSTIQAMILTAFALAASFSFYKAITARCPWQRRYSFLLPFIFRLVMLVLRATGIGGGHPQALHQLILQDIIAIVGAFMGASNIPERWFPGTLDLFLNSHHFMHILVVIAAYQMHLAVIQDLTWMTHVDQGIIPCY